MGVKTTYVMERCLVALHGRLSSTDLWNCLGSILGWTALHSRGPLCQGKENTQNMVPAWLRTPGNLCRATWVISKSLVIPTFFSIPSFYRCAKNHLKLVAELNFCNLH